MKYLTTSDFWQAYKKLSPAMKGRAKKAYKLWQENSLHPSLHFKKVSKKRSVRISCGCRALALKEGDDYYLDLD